MNSLTPGRKILATGAFLTLALSPSFLDWQQSPEKRRQWLITLFIVILVIIILAIIVAALGGFDWNIIIGHFHWNTGVRK